MGNIIKTNILVKKCCICQPIMGETKSLSVLLPGLFVYFNSQTSQSAWTVFHWDFRLFHWSPILNAFYLTHTFREQQTQNRWAICLFAIKLLIHLIPKLNIYLRLTDNWRYFIHWMHNVLVGVSMFTRGFINSKVPTQLTLMRGEVTNKNINEVTMNEMCTYVYSHQLL